MIGGLGHVKSSCCGFLYWDDQLSYLVKSHLNPGDTNYSKSHSHLTFTAATLDVLLQISGQVCLDWLEYMSGHHPWITQTFVLRAEGRLV